MDDQRGSTSTRPVPGAAAEPPSPIPRNTAERSTESTRPEPTKVDGQTQQGSVTLFILVTCPTRLFTASDPRNLHTPADPHTGFSHTSYVGSTQPGDGAAARVVVDAPSWKEKVIGYAKKTRGTMLRKVWVQVWRFYSPHSDRRTIARNQRARTKDPRRSSYRQRHQSGPGPGRSVAMKSAVPLPPPQPPTIMPMAALYHAVGNSDLPVRTLQ